MITATDDRMVRTHDDLLTVLVYAVPGARVRLEPIREDPRPETVKRTRRLVISLDRAGGAIDAVDLVSLPVNAERIANRAREVVEAALRAA